LQKLETALVGVMVSVLASSVVDCYYKVDISCFLLSMQYRGVRVQTCWPGFSIKFPSCGNVYPWIIILVS